MKTKLYFLVALLGIASWTACTKDEETEQVPVVKMNIEDSPINGKVNESILFSAFNVNNKAYEQEWKLDGLVKSNAADYDFTPLAAGIYNIEYTASNSAGVFSYKYVVNVGIPTVPSGPGSNSYVTKVFEFLPGPGQYTNKTLGSMEGAKSLEGHHHNDHSLPLRCRGFDIWHTLYEHPIDGAAGIVEWFKGSRLRPYLDALGDRSADFLAAYQARIAKAYPQQYDSKCLLRFPRLFFVAVK